MLAIITTVIINIILMINVKSCEKSEILPHMEVNQVICYNFMVTGRRYETPGSETKDSLLFTALTIG